MQRITRKYWPPANSLYLQGGETLARGLASFDLEWANIQAGHTWVAAQSLEADEDTAQLGMTYPDAVRTYLICGSTHASRFAGWKIALAATRRLNHRQGEGNRLGTLGIAYWSLAETQRAIQFYEKQLLIACEIGDRGSEGIALWNLSLALDQLGERGRAIQHAEQSLIIREQIEDPNAAKVRAQLAAWREQTTPN
jgi:tetratricopeptide (TPR) repeat protein